MTTFSARRPRLWVGAAYGFGAGALYALSAGTINALTFADLPMRVDGPALLLTVAVWGVGLGALGLITAWPPGTWRGIVWGATALALAVLGYSLTQSASRPEAQVLVLFFTLAPVLVMCLPATAFLRWLINRQIGLADSPAPARWQAALITAALAASLIPGLLARMSPPAEQAVRATHALMQTGADPAGQLLQTFSDWPELRAHVGQPYTLSQSASEISAQGYDVRVHYADGYGLLCVWVTMADKEPYLRSCAQQFPP